MYVRREIPSTFAAALEIRLMSGLDTSCRRTLELLNASRTAGIEILRAPSGSHIGYISTAKMDRWTLRALARKGEMPGSGHEWTEGNIRVIHDVVFVPGWNAVCAQLLRAYVYQHRAVARVRNGRVLWSARRRGKHAPRPLSA